MKKRGGLVYSTDKGRVCSGCGWPATSCRCAGAREQPAGKSGSRGKPSTPQDGVVRVSKETKGRKGKGVTIVTGVPLPGDALRDLAKRLKKKCGSGGTVRDGVIEVQGDHRDALVKELEAQGFTVKRVGG